jgi:asparagine synthase (glutamine-hydrolysing)
LEPEFARRTKIAERLSRSHIQPRFPERARQENYDSAINIKYIQMSINWTERMGVHFHQEARHPFLDRRLAEFIMSIPPEQTFRVGLLKYILREAMRGILPEKIRTRRRKTEFSSYINLGLRIKEISKIRALIACSIQDGLKLIYLSKLQRIYENYISKGYYLIVHTIWPFISLELWLRKFLDVLEKEE